MSRQMRYFRRALCALFVFGCSLTSATTFTNSYISFDLPPNWDCKLEGTEYVCVSKYEKESKEAIIIFTAKEVGPTDSLDAYKTHLSNPRTLPDKSGKTVPSQVLHVQPRMISDHRWIDSLHLGSEISSYYTRYLATVKNNLAILVTLSAHKTSYTKYSSDFLRAIESLRVVATKDLLDSRQASAPTGSEVIGPSASIEIDGPTNELPPPPSSGSSMQLKIFALILLIAAIGYYLWRKKRS